MRLWGREIAQEASRGDEMDLRRGAVYRVVAERGQWLLGENEAGDCRGEFPGTYVEHGAVSTKTACRQLPVCLSHSCTVNPCRYVMQAVRN